MDDHLVHTTPNPHLLKMDVLPKTFVQIILAAKMAIVTLKYVPQTAATTFTFSSVCFFFYGRRTAVNKILSIIVVAESTPTRDDKLFSLFLSSNIIFDNKLYRTKYVYHIFSHSDVNCTVYSVQCTH